MTKLTIMWQHIKARESIGFEYTLWQKMVGLFKMMWVSSTVIESATKNILAGNVMFDKHTGMLTVK